MTSATTLIEGSSRMSSKRSVSRPGAAPSRSRAASRTSARTTRTGRPATRSTTSARSRSSRSTDDPTVPYPSRPMPSGSLVTGPDDRGLPRTSALRRYAPALMLDESQGTGRHAVVVGCGRVGSAVTLRLEAAGWDVAVIDERAETFQRLGEGFSGQHHRGPRARHAHAAGGRHRARRRRRRRHQRRQHEHRVRPDRAEALRHRLRRRAHPRSGALARSTPSSACAPSARPRPPSTSSPRACCRTRR